MPFCLRPRAKDLRAKQFLGWCRELGEVRGDMRQGRRPGKSATPVGDSEENSGKLCNIHASEFPQPKCEGAGVFIPIYLAIVC